MSDPAQLDLLDWLAAQPPDPVPVVREREPDPTAPDLLPVLLRRVDPSQNMRRYYSLALASSLFGEWGVRRQWGRIGTPGRERTDWYVEAEEAEEALQAMLRAKRRRGYVS